MQAWKVMSGVGAACAACCALPSLSVAGVLAASASALWACAGEFLPVATALCAAAAVVAAVGIWRKRRAARLGACGCAPCAKGAEDAGT